MKKSLLILVALMATLLVAPSVLADDIELRLKSGATWRGAIGDKVEVTYVERGVEITQAGTMLFVSTSPAYITFETEVAGKMVEKTVFGGDIKGIAATSGKKDPEVNKPTGGRRHVPGKPRRAPGSGLGSPADAGGKDIPRDDLGRPLGVFVLPLEGGVGQEFRHDEIKKMIKYVDDNYGPNQNIVLYINSNGGLVLESLDIADTIHEARKRHRIVAWVDKAISAGCMTAMCCDEIYFRSQATAGSVTTLAGGTSLQGAEVERHVEHFAELAEKSGYSEHVARSMKLNRHETSYDKDPVTGEITWYGDLRGEFDLSNKDQNLSFNADNALHSGFSKGTADTGEELAELMNLPQWYEISDFGREIAKDWAEQYKRLQRQFEDIQYDLQERNQRTGDPILVLSTQKKAIQKIIRSLKKHPRITWLTFSAGQPDPEACIRFWEMQLTQIDKAISDMRRR